MTPVRALAVSAAGEDVSECATAQRHGNTRACRAQNPSTSSHPQNLIHRVSIQGRLCDELVHVRLLL